MLAAALALGAAVFPPQSRRRRQTQGGGATPGLGFLQPMRSSPGRPPGGGPSSPAPRSTVMAHGEGRTQSRTRAPSSPPSLLPASLLGNIPPRPGGDGDLSPPPWGRGWRRELLQSPQRSTPSREHPRPYRGRDALVVRVRGTTPSGSPLGPWHLYKSLNKQQKSPNPSR